MGGYLVSLIVGCIGAVDGMKYGVLGTSDSGSMVLRL